MKIDENYSTRDLAEAAFLYASGSKLIETERDNGKCWFVFSDKLVCQKLADSFWRKEAMINAREFYNSMRTLKDLIFNRERR